jgi:nucleoside-diphosphate-sugar epimerase
MASLKDAAVLVVGGTGFLGVRLVERLLKEGAEVTVLGRSLSVLPPALSRARLLKADLDDPESVAPVVARAKPEFVFLLPKIRDLRAATKAALTVAEAARGAKRFVRTGMPLGDAASAHAERALHALLAAKVPLVTLNLFRVYGPGQEPTDLIPALVAQARRRSVLTPPPDSQDAGPQDLVHVDDAVEAFLRAAVAPKAVGRSIDIGSGRVLSQERIARALARALSPLAGRTLAAAWRASSPGPGSAADPRPAKELLGWRPRVSLAEGARRLWRSKARRGRIS